MKITQPNYTQTPNDLFDHWLPYLKEGELKVLLVIMRKTFGWHKIRDKISISQLAAITGLTEETVVIATRSLQQKGVIIKNVIGPPGKQETYYELVISEDSNNSYPSDKTRTPLGFTPPGETEAQKKPSLPKEQQQQTKQDAVAVVSLNDLGIEQVDPYQQQSDTKIYSCLRGVDPNLIPIEQKIAITRDFDEQRVVNGLIFAQVNKSKIKTTFIAYLLMACQRGLKIEKKQHAEIPPINETSLEEILENRDIVNQYLTQNWGNLDIRRDICDKVEFVRLGNDELYYKDHKFKELFEHYIRKMKK